MINVFPGFCLDFVLLFLSFHLWYTFSDPTSKQYGHFKAGAHKGQKVRLIRLSRFVNQIVATRKIPNLSKDTYGVPKYVDIFISIFGKMSKKERILDRRSAYMKRSVIL